MHAFALYNRYLLISLRGQWRYRSNMIFQLLAQALVCGTDFLAMAILLNEVGRLGPWGLAELAVLYSLVNIAFSLSAALGRGFHSFGNTLRQGNFDRLLLRPRSILLQLLGQECSLRHLGQLAQALIVLIWLGEPLWSQWSWPDIALCCWAIAGAAALFIGLNIIQAIACFWTIEGLEVFHCLTYGGSTLAAYPMTCYSQGIRRFFTYIVPLTAVCYLPALHLTGMPEAPDTVVVLLSPLAGWLFLLIAAACWGIGMRRHQSTGS